MGGDIVAAGSGIAAVMLLASPANKTVVGIALLAVLWPVLLAGRGAYSRRSLVATSERRLVLGTAAVFVTLLVLAEPVLPVGLSYSTFLILMLMLPAVSILARYGAERWTRRLRQHGKAVRRVLAVGHGPEVSRLIDQLADATDHAYVVVGACVEGTGELVEDVPEVGRLPEGTFREGLPGDAAPVQVVLGCLDRVAVDGVCVMPRSQFTGERLRALSWALSDRDTDLITVPGHVDVATHRMRLENAGGVTMLHMLAVRHKGIPRFAKMVMDRALAALVLLLAMPLMFAIGVAVRLSSPGPALFRQVRLGRDGRAFTMFKFRSMRADADLRRAEVAELNEHDGFMFKMKNDPRVTALGRRLRRTSLDELPQLINVLRGEMSLVGPRPPLPEEVAGYNTAERRRLRVTPGMTGLWQVSGRSTLSWDMTVRLDLCYVDNWNLGLDAQVMWKTGRAVFRGTGAY